jgi:hypothetical protein
MRPAIQADRTRAVSSQLAPKQTLVVPNTSSNTAESRRNGRRREQGTRSHGQIWRDTYAAAPSAAGAPTVGVVLGFGRMRKWTPANQLITLKDRSSPAVGTGNGVPGRIRPSGRSLRLDRPDPRRPPDVIRSTGRPGALVRTRRSTRRPPQRLSATSAWDAKFEPRRRPARKEDRDGAR